MIFSSKNFKIFRFGPLAINGEIPLYRLEMCKLRWIQYDKEHQNEKLQLCWIERCVMFCHGWFHEFIFEFVWPFSVPFPFFYEQITHQRQPKLICREKKEHFQRGESSLVPSMDFISIEANMNIEHYIYFFGIDGSPNELYAVFSLQASKITSNSFPIEL